MVILGNGWRVSMEIKLKIKFEDGKILEISEEKAKELYYKLKGIYDQSVWIEPWSSYPDYPNYPIITYGDEPTIKPCWRPMLEITS